MKITKELKDVIQRQLSRKMDEEARAVNNERLNLVDRLNGELAESAEFKTMIDAIAAWEDKVNAVAEENRDCVARCTGYNKSWDFARYLNDSSAPAPLYYKNFNSRERREDIYDTIILKLSYEKDFEKAVAILAEYGITLG